MIHRIQFMNTLKVQTVLNLKFGFFVGSSCHCVDELCVTSIRSECLDKIKYQNIWGIYDKKQSCVC